MNTTLSTNFLNTVSGFAKTALLGTAIGLLSASTTLADEKLSADKIASMLSKGGYVIYIRHASTEKDYADQVTADVNNCSTQRTLRVQPKIKLSDFSGL